MGARDLPVGRCDLPLRILATSLQMNSLSICKARSNFAAHSANKLVALASAFWPRTPLTSESCRFEESPHLAVDLVAQPADLALRDAADAHGLDQIVDRARRDALRAGFPDDGSRRAFSAMRRASRKLGNVVGRAQARRYPGPERRYNPPSNPFGQPGRYRLVTRIGRPPCGWVVSFWTGQGLVSATQSKRKRDKRTASEMTASCMAKLMPMQTRGPAPNGRY